MKRTDAPLRAPRIEALSLAPGERARPPAVGGKIWGVSSLGGVGQKGNLAGEEYTTGGGARGRRRG